MPAPLEGGRNLFYLPLLKYLLKVMQGRDQSAHGIDLTRFTGKKDSPRKFLQSHQGCSQPVLSSAVKYL
jgi:hypothetical protein